LLSGEHIVVCTKVGASPVHVLRKEIAKQRNVCASQVKLVSADKVLKNEDFVPAGLIQCAIQQASMAEWCDAFRAVDEALQSIGHCCEEQWKKILTERLADLHSLKDDTFNVESLTESDLHNLKVALGARREAAQATMLDEDRATGRFDKLQRIGEELQWLYLDNREEHGPFTSSQMKGWFQQGFFPRQDQLLVRLPNWSVHVLISKLYPRPISETAFDGPPCFQREEGEGQFGEKYINYECIGRGGFGVVRLCQRWADPPLQGDCPRLASKWIQRPSKSSDSSAVDRNNELQQRELLILTRLRSLPHPNLAQYEDFDVNIDGILHVFKYEKHGNLKQVLNKDIKRSLFPEEAVHVCRQLLTAVKFLHEKRIIHRDLKHENILVAQGTTAEEDQEDGFVKWLLHVKVTDFGLSTMEDDFIVERRKHLNPSFVGTPKYMAPETCSRDGRLVSEQVDLWACGILLYYLATLHYPHSQADVIGTWTYTVEGDLRSYEIITEERELVFQQGDHRGFLTRSGEGFHAILCNSRDGGRLCGYLRLSIRSGKIHSNFRPSEGDEWGDTVIAEQAPCLLSEEVLAACIESNIPESLCPVTLGLLKKSPDLRMGAQEALAAIDARFPAPQIVINSSIDETGIGGACSSTGDPPVIVDDGDDESVDEVLPVESNKRRRKSSLQEQSDADLAFRLHLQAEAAATRQQHQMEIDATVARDLQIVEDCAMHTCKEHQETTDQVLARRLQTELAGECVQSEEVARAAQEIADEECARDMQNMMQVKDDANEEGGAEAKDADVAFDLQVRAVQELADEECARQLQTMIQVGEDEDDAVLLVQLQQHVEGQNRRQMQSGVANMMRAAASAHASSSASSRAQAGQACVTH
jgi:serine/threonine protein kinase